MSPAGLSEFIFFAVHLGAMAALVVTGATVTAFGFCQIALARRLDLRLR